MSVTVNLTASRQRARSAARARYRTATRVIPPGVPVTTCPFCLDRVPTRSIVVHERRCAAEYRNPPDPAPSW